MDKRNRKRTLRKKFSQDDRRLGLLGLTASRQEKDAPCPSSEELAALIDRRGQDDGSHDELLHHIANCESCFQEWLILSRETTSGQEKKPKIIRLFSTPRNLAAAGSAMAVAVSVVVFFAVPHYQVTKVIAPQEMETVILVEEEEEQERVYRDEKRHQVQQDLLKVSPVPAPALKGAVQQRSATDKDGMSDEIVAPEKRRLGSGSSMASGEPARSFLRMKKKSEGFEVKEEKQLQNFSQFSEFLGRVCEGSRSNEIDKEDFRNLINEGEYLLSHPGKLSEEELVKLGKVIKLWENENSLTGSELCLKAIELLE